MSETARALMMPEAERVRGDTLARVRPKKAASAFRTISEVADQLHIPQHVLRFWETKFQQVKPLKRGGGRRYYRPEDIGLLQRISNMLYIQGYTIKVVQRLLREGGGKLADHMPASNQNERDSDGQGNSSGQEKESDMNMMSVVEPELPLPGLTPPGRPTILSVSQANARMQKAEAEAERLRALLGEVLSELEALRARMG